MAKPHKVVSKRVVRQSFSEDDVKRDSQGYRKRNYEGLERLTKEIKVITQPILGKRGFAGVDIIECWFDIVGPDLSVGIRPEKLTFEKDSRTNGTLHVKSAGGAYAVLFEHQKQQVIERINTFFGYPAVSKIHIMQGRLTFPKIELPQPVKKPTKKQLRELNEKIAHIEDEALRESMYQMGISFLQKQK